ncbi:MAG: REP-associated tyrosine transposase [Pirellula sp.]|jgi:putative transposase
MSDYRRWYVPGGTFFLTIVTYNRRPILTTDMGRMLLRRAIDEIRTTKPFSMIATVLLPDHWHVVLALPSGDSDYSTRMKRIKEEFTKSWLERGLPEAKVTDSQGKRGERGIWQPRYWEHTITDERDLEGCVDYTHWNPRKHGLVSRLRDWPWSSFHRYVAASHYPIDWGGTAPTTYPSTRDWGE